MSQSDDHRPDPDRLLTEVSRAPRPAGHGQLRVFLGMVAGVGKTYAMLLAARQLRSQGVDVVAGWIDTHGRRETAALLEGLEQLPRRRLDYRGVTLEELDLDGVLRRRPKVVLVDELAHTNAPGSRHTKRYLDIVEILAAGIDVYTTVNVQHLESRAGTVQEITGVQVRETVPDSFLDKAEEVILIDLPPAELRRRLEDGRIYPAAGSERTAVAADSFFQQGNLTALREMALRLAAERVDRDLRRFKVLHGIDGVWKSGNRLMVAVYASPYSEALIRWTRRLADLTDGTWLGVYIEGERPLRPHERELLAKNMALVIQLGGEVISTRDVDPVAGLLRAARQHNVTQLVVGKSKRGALTNILRGGSVVSRLIKQSAAVDVYVVGGDQDVAGGTRASRDLRRLATAWPRPAWDELGWVVVAVLTMWLLAAGIEPLVGYLAVGILFLAGVSVAGLFLSRASVFLLALAFGLIHNYFFIPPIHDFAISKPEDILTLTMYFVAAATLGHLTNRLRQKERVLQASETRALALFALSKDLAAAQSLDEVVKAGLRHLRTMFGVEVALLLPGPAGLAVHPDGDLMLDERERGVADWVMVNGAVAGRSTETLPAAKAIYLPLAARQAVLGVIGIRLDARLAFDAGDLSLAETFARQIAAGIERERFHEQGRLLQVMQQTQKLYKTLLDSVSHELKTPLAAIQGSASALADPLTASRQDAVVALAGEVVTATDRLQRLVDQLLDMTRIESGMLRPKRDLADVEDVIGSALRRIEPLRGQRSVTVKIAPGLPPIVCDEVLLVQALVNILHNACVYTPERTRLEIEARLAPSAPGAGTRTVWISCRDDGPGLPADHPARVLEKFFRGSPDRPGGVGLGLSITLGFIELQGGTLTAANYAGPGGGGGAVFTIAMPAGGDDAA